MKIPTTSIFSTYVAGALLYVIIAALSSTARADAPVDPLNPSVAYGNQVSYGIYRNNQRIGSHTVDFSRTGENLKVDVASTLVVRVFKIPVYRFDYRATEQWENGQLQSVDASVTEKGETTSVSLRRAGEQIRLTAADGSSTLSDLEFASNHWHAGVLATDMLFNTLTGKANQVDITMQGTDTLEIDGMPAQATHYRYSGELQTDVWYDTRQRWIKLRFAGSDGSVIEYRCEGFIS